MSRESSVGIGTGYRLDGRVLIPGRGKTFATRRTDRLWGPHSLCPVGTGGSFPWVKGAGPVADQSSPSSAEVKNDGDISPLPNTSSWNVAELIEHRVKCTFINHNNH
jgi:hypothetical protein